MKKNTIKKGVLMIILSVAAAFSLINTASADMGPKDQLTIHVKNPPDELYYLDLLTEEPGTYDNLGEDRAGFNQDMLALLNSYEGWRPALTDGTNAPIFGTLIGQPNGGEMIHTFSYFGVPETYRIIIVTQSGAVAVSDVHTRDALQSSVTYNFSTGKMIASPVAVSYILQFLKTCIPTLIIEGLILLLFGFKLKENYLVFLITNVSTQILLTATMGTAFIREGPFSAFIVQIPAEIAILIAETIVFAKLLKGKSTGRRCLFGIVSNLVSWALGILLLFYIS